jgi:hypothetical protein
MSIYIGLITNSIRIQNIWLAPPDILSQFDAKATVSNVLLQQSQAL